MRYGIRWDNIIIDVIDMILFDDKNYKVQKSENRKFFTDWFIIYITIIINHIITKHILSNNMYIKVTLYISMKSKDWLLEYIN